MIGTQHIWIDPAYVDLLRELGLASVEPILAFAGGRVCAWSRTTDTVHVPPAQANRPGVYLKRYYYPRWKNRLRGVFRGTFFGQHRAEAEAALLDEMRSLGILAVRPIAWGARRVGHFVTACFLITEEVPGACNLTTFAGHLGAARAVLPQRARRRLIRQFAETIGRLHDSGFSHGQLYWRNILVREHPIGGFDFHLLDARPRNRALKGAVRGWLAELGHLLASATPFTTARERLRFLAHYCETRGVRLDRGEIAAVEQAAAGKASHEKQRILMNERFEAWSRALELERDAARLAASSPEAKR